MPFTVKDVSSQKQALALLAQATRRATIQPEIVITARALVDDCPARDDECELQALYEAVKHGDKRVAALKRGVRYVSDPVFADFFQGPRRLLKSCAGGACAGDCDEHAALVAALAGALGFRTGLRVWAPPRGLNGYEHVYACAAGSKQRPDGDPRRWLGMDTTVDYADIGWDPPSGKWLTAVVI